MKYQYRKWITSNDNINQSMSMTIYWKSMLIRNIISSTSNDWKKPKMSENIIGQYHQWYSAIQQL